jgi:hypothetical protein
MTFTAVNRNARILLLVATALLVVAIVFFLSNQASTLRSKDRIIRLSSKETVSRFIVQSKTDTVMVEKQAQGWRVNSRYPASQRQVDLLLNSLQRIRVMGPVSRQMSRWVNDSLESKAIRIRVYEGRKRAADFLVLAQPGRLILRNTRGRTPMMAEIIGTKNTGAMPWNASPKHWRDRVLIHYDPQAIQSICLDYTGMAESSFTLRREEEDFVLTSPGNVGYPEQPDQKKAILYFSYFYRVEFESFVDTLPHNIANNLADKLICTIGITGTDGKAVDVKLYHWVHNGITDPYRVLCSRSDEPGFLIARYLDLDPLLKKRSYFLVPEKSK